MINAGLLAECADAWSALRLEDLHAVAYHAAILSQQRDDVRDSTECNRV